MSSSCKLPMQGSDAIRICFASFSEQLPSQCAADAMQKSRPQPAEMLLLFVQARYASFADADVVGRYASS